MISIYTQKRIELLTELKEFINSEEESWIIAKQKATQENGWFTDNDIKIAIENISSEFLDKYKLEQWIQEYPDLINHPTNTHKKVGLIMAGNIPLVGFHDFICLYIAGFKINLKLSHKDTALWLPIIDFLNKKSDADDSIMISDSFMKNCDAYIATGSNNSSRYFEQYFGKYPQIIRKNRTSVAIIEGDETKDELKKLAEDIFTFYGLGCRNVTHIYVPTGYDFSDLLSVFSEQKSLQMHSKYTNNYDYHLAIYLLNKVDFIQHENVLLVKNDQHFAPIATLHYSFYEKQDIEQLKQELKDNEEIQAVINKSDQKMILPGCAQKPSLHQYPDGVDTMGFLSELTKT